MSGSRRYFQYTDDDSNNWVIQLDESTAESTALGFPASFPAALRSNLQARLSPTKKFPLEPRHILAERTDADDRVIRRKYVVASTTAPAWVGAVTGVTIDGQDYNITARVGEIRHYIPPEDTGLIDGDVDSNVSAAV